MSTPYQYQLPLEEATAPSPEAEANQKAIEDRVIQKALGYLERRHHRGEPLTSPEDTKAFLRLKLANRPAEVFVCLFLDRNCKD